MFDGDLTVIFPSIVYTVAHISNTQLRPKLVIFFTVLQGQWCQSSAIALSTSR